MEAMNKYLEKIAGMIGPDAKVGKVDKPLPAVAPGSKLASGAKTLFNKALLKSAKIQTLTGEPTAKQDIVNTGVIGGLGAISGYAANKGMEAAPKLFGQGVRMRNAKLLAVGGAAGLAADYAGLKINNAINKHVQ
jgi:hypothetical protein